MSATSSSKPPSSSAGQSWYVSTGSTGCSNLILDTSFCVWCRGDCTSDEVSGTHHTEEGGLMFQDEEPLVERMRGNDMVFRRSNGRVFDTESDRSCCLFIGLTTSPSTAVVDTAAQDGLIGRPALERLKQQLGAVGLQISWTKKRAKAHGVGGPANVVGIVAIPLGLAGTTGILETTVVENDVPLLLPVTLLDSLQAVIDVHAEKMYLRRIDRTVELIRLPSGHLAVDVLNFGSEGYRHPEEAKHAGWSECDFRCGSGSESGSTMLLQVHDCASPSGHVVGSLGAVSTCFQSASCRHPYGLGGCAQTKDRCKAGYGPLETSSGQGVQSARAHWIGRIGELMVATGLGGPAAFPIVLQAVGRVRGHRRADEAPSRQDFGNEDSGGVSTCNGQADDGWQPVRLMGDLLGLSQPMESSTRPHPRRQEDEGEGGSSGGELWRGVQDTGCEGEDCNGDPSRVRAEVPEPPESKQGRESEGSDSPEVGASRGGEDGCAERHHDERVCRDVNGQNPLRGTQRILRWGDVRHCREEACLSGGDEGLGRVAAGVSGDSGRDDSRANADGGEHGNGIINTGCEEGPYEEGEIPLTGSCREETWVRLKGEGLEERLRALRGGAHYEVVELYAEDGEGEAFLIDSDEELEGKGQCLVKMRPTLKNVMEDEVSEVEETALPKKLKTKLRRVEGRQKEVFAVDVAEVYSPPRIAKKASESGLRAGGSYDIQTGYDLTTPEDIKKMWEGLVEDDPELTVLCPPCTPCSVLQSWNYDRMLLVKAICLLGEGLYHVEVAAEVALWQYYRRKLFLFEHPLGSKAWSEEVMQHLMQLPGVFVCRTDMCRYGMRVRDGLNLKPTRWVTNSWEIARELQRRCNGEHQHEALLGGKAADAAVYPPQLCQAVVRGLKRHLRAKGEVQKVCLEETQVIEVMAAHRQPLDEDDDDLDVFEDILPEEVEGFRAQRKEDRKERERQRIEAAVTAEDKAKVHKMHVNLGQRRASSVS